MTDWVSWRKHVDAAVADQGQWLGLLDETFSPILNLPPLLSLSAGGTRLSPAELQVKVSTRGVVTPTHPIVDELVAQGLGVFEERGYLVPAAGKARVVCVAREGSRRPYLVTHSTASGSLAPTELEIFGADGLSYLQYWPCPSVPRSWLPRFQTWEEDAGGPYEKPRVYAPVEMATVADGYTMSGPAERVIRTLVQDSFDAVNTAKGWKTPHMVVDYLTVNESSPHTNIRVEDQSVWDTISEPARLAGVNVGVDLWWPGDPAVMVRAGSGVELRVWDHPILVCRIEQKAVM